MRIRRRWRFLHGMFVFSQWGFLLASAMMAGLLKVDTKHLASVRFLEKWIDASQAHAWWIIPICTGMVALSKGARSLVGSPWKWATVQKLIDRYKGEVFNRQDDDDEHDHRVTLFKHTEFKLWIWPFRSRFWPWGWPRHPLSGWLVPIARSGHTTKVTSTIFLAPDDATCSEGLAGKVWASNRSILIVDLPELSGDSVPEAIGDYARKSFSPEAWVKKRLKEGKSLPRSLFGIPVEVNNRLWGVIVLDSTRPDSLRTTAHSWQPYEALVKMVLGEILKAGG